MHCGLFDYVTGSCIGYDVINLTSTMSSVPLNEPGAEEATGNDPVAIFPGQAEGFVYTGTAVEFGTPSQYRMSLGSRRRVNPTIKRHTAVKCVQ